MSAKQPDLPLWLLQQQFADICSTKAPAASDDPAESNQKQLIQVRQAQLLSARAAAGDVAGVQWLRSHGCAWSSHSTLAAAEAGHVEVLAWLLSQRPASCPMDAGLCALAAATAGQVHVLDFLKAELLLRPFDLAACAEAASAAGQQETLDWLVVQDDSLSMPAWLPDQAAAAAAARQQVRQIMDFAKGRAPPAVSVSA